MSLLQSVKLTVPQELIDKLTAEMLHDQTYPIYYGAGHTAPEVQAAEQMIIDIIAAAVQHFDDPDRERLWNELGGDGTRFVFQEPGGLVRAVATRIVQDNWPPFGEVLLCCPMDNSPLFSRYPKLLARVDQRSGLVQLDRAWTMELFGKPGVLDSLVAELASRGTFVEPL